MSDDYDSHSRTGLRTARIRRISQRPSEVNDTREKSKGSAYKKSAGVDKCDKCKRQFYVAAMTNLVCQECQLQGAK